MKPNERNPENYAVQTMVHYIRIKGHLGDHQADLFGDVTITLEENGGTLLTCQAIGRLLSPDLPHLKRLSRSVRIAPGLTLLTALHNA
jgi:hypothetical protein